MEDAPKAPTTTREVSFALYSREGTAVSPPPAREVETAPGDIDHEIKVEDTAEIPTSEGTSAGHDTVATYVNTSISPPAPYLSYMPDLQAIVEEARQSGFEVRVFPAMLDPEYASVVLFATIDYVRSSSCTECSSVGLPCSASGRSTWQCLRCSESRHARCSWQQGEYISSIRVYVLTYISRLSSYGTARIRC